MNALTSIIIMATIGSAHLQCLTRDDNYLTVPYSTDLSGVTDFGIELYRQLAPGKSTQNFIFSPYSIWSTLMITYLGSAWNTEWQLRNTLRVDDKVSTLRKWRDLEGFYARRQSHNNDHTLDIANRAYYKKNMELRSCLVNLLGYHLHKIKTDDYAETARDIGTFVSESTSDLINNVVTASHIVDSMLILTNGAYFKGTWKQPFQRSDTRTSSFYLTPNNPSPVNMMVQSGFFRYGISRQLGARVLELPYTGDLISMYVLIPAPEASSISRFTKMIYKLNGDDFRQAIHFRNLTRTKVEVHLPKFKLKTQMKHELQKGLKDLGIGEVFDNRRADLSVFTRFGNGLSIDKSHHKAYIEVNEEGTEAAAASALVVPSSASVPVTKNIKFSCDEPFVYVIYDKETNNIIFLGSFTDPLGGL